MNAQRTIKVLVFVSAIVWVITFLYLQSAYPPELTAKPQELVFTEDSFKREQELLAKIESLRMKASSPAELVEAHLNLALHYLAQEQNGLADDQIDAAKNLVDLSKPSLTGSELFNGIANIYELRADYAKACEAYFKADKLCPPDTDLKTRLQKARTLNNIGNLYLLWAQMLKQDSLRKNNFNSAETYLKLALSEIKDNQECKNSTEGRALIKTICTNYKVCLEDLGRGSEVASMSN
jgi:tetratricopeptide (TPR) repeat protein